VQGRVQGVGFRYTTVRVASRLSLAGWIRNMPDRSVAVRAQGDDEAITRLITFLEAGPPAASVTALSIRDVPVVADLGGFEIRH